MPLDEVQKKELYDSLVGDYNNVNAEADKKYETATADANKKRMWGGIGDGLVQMFQAEGTSRGANYGKPKVGEILNDQADRTVSDAAGDRKKAVEQYLMKGQIKDKVDNQALEQEKRDIAAQDRTFDQGIKTRTLDISEKNNADSIAQRAQASRDANALRQDSRDNRLDDKAEDRAYKEGIAAKSAEEKKKLAVTEVEDRRRNIALLKT